MEGKHPLIVIVFSILFGGFTRLLIGTTHFDAAGVILSLLFAIGLLSVLFYSLDTGKIFGSFGVLNKHENVVLFSALQITYGSLGVLFASLPYSFGYAV